MTIQGKIVDIPNRRVFKGEVQVENGIIVSIEEKQHNEETFILPGFIDAHIHIESSMLVPSEFARIAVCHGTIATVSDPHEIANVLGIEGVEFMIKNGKQTPFKFNFGAPSCVPATTFETAGAEIDSEGIKQLLAKPDIKYLAEMMNYPGVIYKDQEVLDKIAWAKHYNKPVDGHAPGLRGKALEGYVSADISTDHECFTSEEAVEKLKLGMKILIREGSAAKNFEALIDLLPEHYENIMFCSDDKHPDDLLMGHINQLCTRAIGKGIDVFKVLEVACINPVKHYGLDIGLLKESEPADFIVVKDLKEFETLQTYINGQLVFDFGESKINTKPFKVLNNFKADKKVVLDFKVESSSQKIKVIEALDGELITKECFSDANLLNGELVSDIKNDILKITVVNRYTNEKPSIAFIKNFGLKRGAIASSVAHDSHNIIAVGVTDHDICEAVNVVISNKGGVCAYSEDQTVLVPLPVAGIMSDQDAETVGKQYAYADAYAKQLGSKLKAPFMTLSFMALLVIPALKLSDKGLFDAEKFQFTSIEA